MTEKKRIAVFTANITVYDEVEEGEDVSEAPAGTDVQDAIEDGIEENLGFMSNATVVRTDK